MARKVACLMKLPVDGTKLVLSSVSEEFKDALWDPEIRGRVAT